MAEVIFTLIPVDPGFQPSKEAAERALNTLRPLVPSGEVRFEYLDSVTFFNPGTSWPGVSCSACHADASSWWPQAMLAARANGFQSLNAVASCCGQTVDLNQLAYAAPTGFARFALEAHNPCFDQLSPENMAKLERTLGTLLKPIVARLG